MSLDFGTPAKQRRRIILLDPVIGSDGVSILESIPAAEWTFAPISDPATECVTFIDVVIGCQAR